MRNLSAYNRAEIVDWARHDAKQQGGTLLQAAFGIKDDKARELRHSGLPWLYFDHSYFRRGWNNGNFRVCRDDLHLTRILDRPSDRLKRWGGVNIKPWRKTGTEIVIIPPSEAQRNHYGCHDWLMKIESRLCEVTDRPVLCKHSKLSSLAEFCRDAWAVVTFSSVAGVEAANLGIPVFSTENCPSYPLNAGPIEKIESPEYVDLRHELACSLAYASWNTEEMRSVKWIDYCYEVL